MPSLAELVSSHCLPLIIHIQLAVGTGGTIAGVGRFLKTMSEDVVVALSDPEGSGLYNKVTDLRKSSTSTN